MLEYTMSLDKHIEGVMIDQERERGVLRLPGSGTINTCMCADYNARHVL